MDKTSLAIALLVVIILLMCAPQAERPKALGRMVIFAGIGLVVYYIVPTVLAVILGLWYGAVSRYGSHSVVIVTVLVLSRPPVLLDRSPGPQRERGDSCRFAASV
jgi:hypothetical protein